MKRGYWTTRFGFYLAAIGSASGLGNLWRFPYVVGENGGGAFVLLYVAFALLIGLPLLIGELILGKSKQRSVLIATKQLEQPQWKWIGRLSVVLSTLLLSYYAVISGWVLHFLIQFLIDIFAPRVDIQTALMTLQQNGWLQLGLASVHLLITVVVVLRGVQHGLEKFVGALMPIFAVLIVILIARSLSLPSAEDAIRFLFYPNFSKLSFSSIGQAVGHVFFTLSVGFGTMVTFGSYLRNSDHLPTAGFRVAILDTGLSLLAGLVVFPIALQASNIPLTDPGLMFEALPRFLIGSRGGSLFGFVFFLCLYLAALGASIGLSEVVVSNIVDRRTSIRSRASWVVGVFTLLLAAVPAFSGSLFHSVTIFGKGVLEFWDALLINCFLPIIAFGMSLALSYGLTEAEKQQYFVSNNHIESIVLYPYWKYILRYFVPAVIAIAMILQVIGIF